MPFLVSSTVPAPVQIPLTAYVYEVEDVPKLSQGNTPIVVSFGPNDGSAGTVILVNVSFDEPLGRLVRLRLAANGIAVRTHIIPITLQGDANYQLRAVAPEGNAPVTWSLQAVEDNTVLSSANFVTFSYRYVHKPQASGIKRGVSELEDDEDDYLPNRRRVASSGRVRKGSNRSQRFKNRSTQHDVCSVEDGYDHLKIIRATSEMQSEGNTLIVDISGDLTQIPSIPWTVAESAAKRRLVKFQRLRNHTQITTSFEIIPESQYDANSIIISCIWREDTQECIFTSVDFIYLLECLVCIRLTIEEKNRIRRNLEVFKPKNIPKDSEEHEEIFDMIMAFDNPKPRNIEKDIKVFSWECLADALEKICSKYAPAGPWPIENTREGYPGPSPAILHSFQQHIARSDGSVPAPFGYSPSLVSEPSQRTPASLYALGDGDSDETSVVGWSTSYEESMPCKLVSCIDPAICTDRVGISRARF